MDLTSKIVIRTHFNNEFRFVILDYDKFSLGDFMNAGELKILLNSLCSIVNYIIISVRVKFHINGDFRVNAVLRDNLSTRIPADDFCTIIQNYSRSGSFYVHLEYNIVQQNPAWVSNEVITKFKRNFLSDHKLFCGCPYVSICRF